MERGAVGPGLPGSCWPWACSGDPSTASTLLPGPACLWQPQEGNLALWKAAWSRPLFPRGRAVRLALATSPAALQGLAPFGSGLCAASVNAFSCSGVGRGSGLAAPSCGERPAIQTLEALLAPCRPSPGGWASPACTTHLENQKTMPLLHRPAQCFPTRQVPSGTLCSPLGGALHGALVWGVAHSWARARRASPLVIAA